MNLLFYLSTVLCRATADYPSVNYSTTFFLEVGNETYQADMNDFKEVSFSDIDTGSNQKRIKVVADGSGKETIGTFIPGVRIEGEVKKAADWLFVAESSNTGITIVLKNPVGVIRKTSS